MDYLNGKTDFERAVSLIKRNTRRFAKHQLTWLRHFPQVHWVDAAACSGPGEVADRCEAVFGRSA